MATEASCRIFSIDSRSSAILFSSASISVVRVFSSASNAIFLAFFSSSAGSIWLAIPYGSAFGHANLSQIAWLQLSFVPELVARIGSLKSVLLLQSDYPVWKQVLGKP
jgi:hypothetical protein